MATINCHKTITNWWLAKQTKWKFFPSFPMANSSIQKIKEMTENFFWLKFFFLHSAKFLCYWSKFPFLSPFAFIPLYPLRLYFRLLFVDQCLTFLFSVFCLQFSVDHLIRVVFFVVRDLAYWSISMFSFFPLYSTTQSTDDHDDDDDDVGRLINQFWSTIWMICSCL